MSSYHVKYVMVFKNIVLQLQFKQYSKDH